MQNVHVPDIVVRVEVLGYELAQVAFFKGRTVHDDFEIVAGVDDKSHIPYLAEVLKQARTSLYSHDWYSLDELDTCFGEDEKDPPF